MGDWRPIDSAPKDGTWVLLGWSNNPSHVAIGNWGIDGWCDDGDGLEFHNQPSHWMPLPAGPIK